MNRKTLAIWSAPFLLAGIIAGGVVVGRAATQEEAAKSRLEALIDDGNDGVIVAEVEGEPITLREVEVLLALSDLGGGVDPDGNPISQMNRADALDRLVKDKALAIAAERSGVVVSDAEVQLMVQSSLVTPIREGSLPKDTQERLEAHLKALGSSLEEAPQNPDLLRSYRRFLMVQRYITKEGESAAELTNEALRSLSVTTYPERLDP